MKEKVLKLLLDRGILVEPDAAELIMAQKDPVAFVKKFLDGRDNLPLILTAADLRGSESLARFSETEAEPASPPEPQPEPPQTTLVNGEELAVEDAGPARGGAMQPLVSSAPAPRGGGPLQIISDVTGASTCDGSIENFTGYFRDRYRILRRVIMGHVEMGSPVKIKDAAMVGRDVRVIGMVMDLNKTKNGHLGVTIEDDTGELYVLIHKESELIKEAILRDEVVGFVGKVRPGSKAEGKEAMMLAASMHRPPLQANKPQRLAAEDLEVVFMSDLHVGSSHFLHGAWDNFTDWITSDEAKGVRFIIVAGDLVDGIGVYPNQEDELDIPDIHKQYGELARLMSPVPERIQVLMQPGNHDAVRFAEPQPALDPKYRKAFGPNYIFIGNPCHFSIAGVEILSYHGRSIDDLVGAIPGITYHDPVPPMKEMLKRRLLATSFGGKTPIAAEAHDHLLINPIPDILVTGHVHRTAVYRERGMTLINASAWQSQTPFQAMHNFHPDPAKIVVTNLRTGRCRIIDFLGKCD